MRRFGLPILLSACYAGLLLLVFNSDFGREHSFLLRNESASLKAKSLQMIHSHRFAAPATVLPTAQPPSDQSAALASAAETPEGGDSPESAGSQH